VADKQIFFSYQKSREGSYEARAVGHSIVTQADTFTELRTNVKNAVALYFADRNLLPRPRLVKVRPRRFGLGWAKSEFTVPDDFNDPLPKEIEDLFW
jgi:hypothetical protein